MPFARTLAISVAVVLGVASSSALVAQSAPAVDVRALGPQVGDRIPDFALEDQHGVRRTTASLMGPNGLILLFYRSADWCPYCKAQLVEQQSAYADVTKSGYGLAAVSYDPVGVLAEFAERRGITYPLLSDPGSKVIRQYGILNTTIPESNTQSYGIPFPGTFIVDPKGIVTSRFFEDAYQERDSLASILVGLGGTISASSSNVSAPHVSVKSYSTNSAVSVGTHFALVLDLAPEERTHVYAPAVSGYKPIRLRIEPQTGIVVGTPEFPEAEDYYFAPLDEHVPVYQRPFRIVQPVSIDPTPDTAAALRDRTSLTIRGTLEYQACDDQACFNPQSIPVTWTVELLPLDRVRATR
jgi:peroxiredoxin